MYARLHAPKVFSLQVSSRLGHDTQACGEPSILQGVRVSKRMEDLELALVRLEDADGSLPALSPPERARELPDIFNVEVCSNFKALHLEC